MQRHFKFPKLLLSLLFLTGIVITTFSFTKAYYSDIKVSQGNLFSAATINLKVGEIDSVAYDFGFQDLEPGKIFEKTVAIHNSGAIEGNFSMEFEHYASSEGENSESETDTEGEGDLDDCIELRVVFDNNSGESQVLFDWSRLVDIEGKFHSGASQDGAINSWINNKVANMTIQARIDNCGNEVYGDTFLMNLGFYLYQIP